MTDHNHYVGMEHSHTLISNSPGWMQSGSYVYNPKAFTQEAIDQMIARIKEKEVSTLDKVRQERQEARERVKIEKAYDAYDKKRLDELGDGAMLRFGVQVDDVTKAYAAIGWRDADGEQRWSTTGRTSPKHATTEDLVAWLIRMKVPATKVRVLQG